MVDITTQKQAPCTQQHYQITAADLPLSCPTREMRLWDAHPRVYLPIENTGTATCPYCQSVFTLSDTQELKTGHE